MKKLLLLFLAALLSVSGSFAGEPLRIAYITDLHLGKAVYHKALLPCIDDINSQDSIDFVLVGGDITNIGSDEQLAAAKKTLDKLAHPYWVVSGNHDSKWSESGCNTFIRTFGYEQFEFEAGGYRFIGCNSGPDMRMAPGLVPRNSMEWLKKLEKGKPVIFLNHYPLGYGLANWFEIRRELIRLDCRLTICGHGHSNRKFDYSGLPGMMGRSTMKGSKTKLPGYNILTIQDGVVTATERSFTADGTVNTNVWYTRELVPVTDTLKYDEHGLPENYKLPTYAVNQKYPQVKVRWARTEDANIGSGFATDGTRAWYATASGKVVCMSLSDGEPLWSVLLGGKIYSTPALKDNILVVPCTDGGIYAFDAATGRQIWKCQTMKGIVASPTIFGKKVYVGDSDGRFRALRLKDGKLLWVYDKVTGFCDGAPYVDKTQVIFTTWGQKMYSLDPRNGTLQWVWVRKGSQMYSPGSCTPIKVGNRVFVVAPDRRTYCLDTWTGEVLYFADCGRESFVLSEDKKTLFVKSMNGTACALPTDLRVQDIHGTLAPDSPSKNIWMPDVPVLEKEKAIWDVKTGLGKDIGSSALSLCGKMLLIPASKGNLHAFDRNTGEQLWMHKVGIGNTNPVAAWKEEGKSCILVSTMDGKIELLEITE